MTNKILSFAVFFLIVFKIVAIYFTEFSLYGDEAQYWLWSQTLDLGYYSKPPLLAWFLGGYSILFGDSFVSLKIFPIVIYFFISFAIYKLCLNLSFDEKKAKLCALSFLIIPAASLSSFLISTDLLLLLFWAISMVLLLKVIKANLTTNFFLLGLVFAGRDNQPMTVQLNNIVQVDFGVAEYNVDMAATILTSMIPLAVYFISGRWFVRGIAAGAIKG